MVNDRQSLDLSTFAAPADGGAVEWLISDAPVPYLEAVAAMEARVADIAAGRAPELVWLLEHPPLYTSGTSGKAADLLDPRFPVFATGRGGQLTYHGPGQRDGVASLVDLGHPVTAVDVDVALRQAFADVFGAVKQPLPETTI